MSDDVLKQKLINKMRNRYNGTAIVAVQQLRDNGWLQDGSLIAVDLSGANLRGADLSSANLHRAYLDGINLSRANLSQANLDGAILSRANMKNINLFASNLSRANLREADLTAANIIATNLHKANLRNTDFTYSWCSETVFIGTDLSSAKGLEHINHRGRNYIDFSTLHLTALSSGTIPEVFLRGCGLSDDEIQYTIGMYGKPIDLYSAFINYSHNDQSFVSHLYNTLQGNGVRCWQDVHELDPGRKIHHEIAKSIRIYDKILLICSRSSLNSRWVNREIEMALLKEEELSSGHVEGVIALIPIDIDGYLFDEEYTGPYKAELTSRLAARFEGWANDHAIFEEQFALLMRSLNPSRENRQHPEPKLKKKPK